MVANIALLYSSGAYYYISVDLTRGKFHLGLIIVYIVRVVYILLFHLVLILLFFAKVAGNLVNLRCACVPLSVVYCFIYVHSILCRLSSDVLPFLIIYAIASS